MSNRIEYMGRYLTLALCRRIDSAAMTVPHSPLTGRRILITGGATGIGAAAVRVLHEAGARVVATYHRTAPAGDVAPVVWLQCDVRDAEAVESTFCTAVEELGRVLNPMIVTGQIHGGVVQGIGQALGEIIRHDPESGQMLTASFMDYQMLRANDCPDFRLATREVPTAVNPLGAKGVGEAGTVGALAAAMNAVNDALAPLGIRHLDMPATSEKIWSIMQAAPAAAI